MDKSTDYDQRKLYSQIEILVADSVINVIDNNHSKHESLIDDKFQIEGTYLI
jgi:hypothetical protein